MPIRFACPNPECGKTIVVKDEFAGRTGKCPGCATPVKIPAAMPAFEVVEDDVIAPPPPSVKKKPVIVVDEEDAPKPKKKPVIVVEDEPEPPKPKKKPVIVVEDEPPASKAKKPAFVVEDEPEVPAPSAAKKPATVPPPVVPATAELVDDDEDEPAPPKKGKPPALRKAAALANYDDDILGRSEWLVREIESMMQVTRAGLFEAVGDKEPYAVIRDGTYKFLGFFAIDIAGLRPRFKFQLRRGDKNGPVLLTLERFVPRFDVPFKPKKPSRWEVRGPDNAVVGSITFSRAGFSVFKWLAKGEYFQNEVCVLDADGRRAGNVTMERGTMGAPNLMVLEDDNGGVFGSFGLQKLEKAKEMMEEARQTGKIKVKFTVGVMGKGEEEWQGVHGRVNPDRVSDPYARLMTLAIAILYENLSFEAFGGVKGRKT